jgi:pyruvate dehydrogenase E2 component (dihydrolipoamide acetyltransferase)
MSKARAFTMPKWGIEMLEGTLSQWSVADGAAFKKGDVLALIETDKINNEIEAEFDGIMSRRIAAEGDTLPVGALLGVITTGAVSADEIDSFVASFEGAPGAAARDAAPPAAARIHASSSAAAPAAARAPAPAATIDTAADEASLAKASPAARNRLRAFGLAASTVRGSGRKGRITLQDVVRALQTPNSKAVRSPQAPIVPASDIRVPLASPYAVKIAAAHDLNLAGIHGSGRNGRIGKADVLARIEQPVVVPASPGTRIVRMSPMRRAIAQRLAQSKRDIPHFYLRMEVRTDALAEMRTQARKATGAAPSFNDYLVRAVALSLMEVPDVNIQVHGEEIHHLAHADVSIAVATDKGLFTPIVFAAETRSVADITQETARLAAAARNGTLSAEQMKGGSFTISNLGMFGIDEFDAIINPPQGAILAVGAIQRRPIEAGHALCFANLMRLTLSCDHRAIDGALGATYMAKLRRLIESPERLTS